MADRKFTDAQRAAIDFLPRDGAWLSNPGRRSAGLNSLHLYHRDLIDYEEGSFGKRGGFERRYRLTEAGKAVLDALSIPFPSEQGR